MDKDGASINLEPAEDVPDDAPPLPDVLFMADRGNLRDVGPVKPCEDFQGLERRVAEADLLDLGTAPPRSSYQPARMAFAISCADLVVRDLALPVPFALRVLVRTGLTVEEATEAANIAQRGGPTEPDRIGRKLDAAATARERETREASEREAREAQRREEIVTLTVDAKTDIAVLPPCVTVEADPVTATHGIRPYDLSDIKGRTIHVYDTSGFPVPFPDGAERLGFLDRGEKVRVKVGPLERSGAGRLGSFLLDALVSLYTPSEMVVNATLTLATDDGIEANEAFVAT